MARTLTLAAIQAVLRRRPGRQHRQDRRPDPRGGGAGRAGDPAAGAVPGALLLRRAGGALVRRRPIPGASIPCVTALAPLAGRARRRAADLDLRARGAALLQQPGDGRRRRHACSGVYRKSHIPDGPGYQEKYYFRPGDTGFRVWDTRFGRLGVGICWDQWYPEAARAMTLMGAEALLYPTAIGSRAARPDARHRRALAARHAGPRGLQRDPGGGRQPHRLRALGRLSRRRPALLWLVSFISDHRGDLVAELGRDDEGVIAGDVRPRLPRRPPRRLGLLPRPPARPLRRADHGPAGVIETERLILRPWRDADRAPFAAMSADPAVMDDAGRGAQPRAGARPDIDQRRQAPGPASASDALGRRAARATARSSAPSAWPRSDPSLADAGWLRDGLAARARRLGPGLRQRGRAAAIDRRLRATA